MDNYPLSIEVQIECPQNGVPFCRIDGAVHEVLYTYPETYRAVGVVMYSAQPYINSDKWALGQTIDGKTIAYLRNPAD